MMIRRVATLCSIAACVFALAACKSGDDDDDSAAGTGGAGAGSGGTSTGSGGAGSGGAMAMGSGGKGAAGTGSGGTGSGGTGSGGTGSGGTGSGGTGSGGTGSGGMSGDSGMMELKAAAATIAGFSGGTVTGTATFSSDADGVTVVVSLMNCPDGMHPVHIHEGTSCADAMAQGAHWGMTRGEGIPSVMCTGNMGTAMFTRPNSAAPELKWSIGGDEATDVIGHAFVVHNNDDMKTRIGCGVIEAD
jgi:Cu/Zn superoxide dismutase